MEALHQGQSGRRVNLTTHFRILLKVNNEWKYKGTSAPPIRLHGVGTDYFTLSERRWGEEVTKRMRCYG